MIEAFITYKKSHTFPDEVIDASEDMAFSGFCSFIDFLAANKEKSCLLTGNDPCLHNRLEELLLHAQAKKIVVILETSGLSIARIKGFIAKSKPVFRWKVYHPGLYPAGEWDALRKDIADFIRKNKIPLELCLVMHDLSLDYNFISDVLKENSVANFQLKVIPAALSVDKKLNVQRLREYAVEIVRLTEKVFPLVIKANLDCLMTPCIFSDADFGFLAKLGLLPVKCLPYIGVLPDLRVYHCRPLLREAKINLADFKDFSQIMNHFFDSYKSIQREGYLFEECRRCFSHKAGVCLKGCLALKKG